MISVVGLGAGGHAKTVISILRAAGGFDCVGLLDPRRELIGTHVAGVEVLGDDSLLDRLRREGLAHVFNGVGSSGVTDPRAEVYERTRAQGYRFVAAVHPSAIIDPRATIGAGPTVAESVIVKTDSRIGDNVLLNTASIVEHDCRIENHVHIATGARLSGEVWVGAGAHVGAGASVRQGVRIGRRAIVGVGAAVVHDVPDGAVVVGVPARVLRGTAPTRCGAEEES